MVEDKLSHDERLKLECLAQSIAFNAYVHGPHPANPAKIIYAAEVFEKYVKGEKD